jgi:predicted phosphohydrolase
MKIAFTSDVHYDISPQNREFLPHLLDAVMRQSPDVFVIAGDIANSLPAMDEALSLFGGLSCRKLMVPGNHDLWVSTTAARKGKDSWHKYTSAIPEVCRKHGFESIASDPIVIDSIGFVGSVGWYDFSLRDRRLDDVYSRDDYDLGVLMDKRFETGIWNDMRFTHWLRHPDSPDWRRRKMTMTAPEVFERVLDFFGRKVAEILDRTEGLVAVIHTTPFAACMRRTTNPDPFDAYGGSERLGKLLLELSAARRIYCLCGHAHHPPLDMTVEGVRVLRAPVGYLFDPPEDYAQKARDMLGILTL